MWVLCQTLSRGTPPHRKRRYILAAMTMGRRLKVVIGTTDVRHLLMVMELVLIYAAATSGDVRLIE